MGEGGDFSDLLRRAQEGDPDAIGVFFRNLQPRLLNYLRARVGQDCEDVASEVWMSVARSLPRFSGDESDLRCWIFTIARRRVSDWTRSSAWRDVATPSAPTEDWADPSGDTADAVANALASHEMLIRLSNSLPADQSRVLLLRVVAGLSTDEVARVLDKRSGAVRMLLHRALRTMAPLVEELFEKSPGET